MKPYVVGICRLWNQPMAAESLPRQHALLDWLVLHVNQPTDGKTGEWARAWAKGQPNVTVVDYDARGIVHESAERTMAYFAARAVADANCPGGPAWFYQFDSDEILDCTRGELDSALGSATRPGLTAKLVDFYPGPGEADEPAGVFAGRNFVAPGHRAMPSFFRHSEDRLQQWRWWPDRFHSSKPVLVNWTDFDSQWVFQESGLWIRHYGYALGGAHDRARYGRYAGFRNDWDRASPWLEKLPGGKDFEAPRLIAYEAYRRGDENETKPIGWH